MNPHNRNASVKVAMAGNRDTYLVLDWRIIEEENNVELTVGVAHKDKNNPLFKEDKPWEPRFDNPSCSVIYDQEEEMYKCWYSIFIKSGSRGDFPGENLPSETRARVNWTEGKRNFACAMPLPGTGSIGRSLTWV